MAVLSFLGALPEMMRFILADSVPQQVEILFASYREQSYHDVFSLFYNSPCQSLQRLA